MEDIEIVEIADEHVEGFNRCVGAVARERRYIALLDQPSLDSTFAFVHKIRDDGGAQFVALDSSGEVVGWCDVVRYSIEGFRHSGKLGMGLLPQARGKGIGARLATATIAAAHARGIERIELEVFPSNARAIRLYERLGFVHEGVHRNARKLDGVYEDNVLMALITPPAQG